MKRTIENIDGILHETFEDGHLSRSEKRALKALVEESSEMRLRVRRRAFELARGFSGGHDFEVVLAWLEEVEKALFEVPNGSGVDKPEAWFSPHDEVHVRLIRAIDAIQTEAKLAVFTITDDRVTRALLAAHGRGVALRILSDNEKANDLGSDIERLAKAGVSVRIDRTDAHMHHKFAIFDGDLLINGSYNWTRSAAHHNQENLVLQRDAVLVSAFEDAFERGWQQGEPW